MRTFEHKPKATQQNTSAKSTTPGRQHFGQSHEVNAILHLQRMIGNRSVQRMLQINPEEDEVRLASTASSHFWHDSSRIPIYSPAATTQKKLAISQPEDVYEKEADRVAEQVMRMPEPRLQYACVCGGGCPRCQTEKPNPEHGRLQTKKVASTASREGTAQPNIHSALSSPGKPLDPVTLEFMESRFGQDFCNVRIHSNDQAAESARSIHSLAYTMGTDIVFGKGQYQPGTSHGKRLLAHELTHVIQQRNTLLPSTVIQRQSLGGPSLDDADLAAERAYGNSGAPKAQKCGRPSHCPAGFCDPYRSEKLAKYYRAKKSSWLMLGISAAVDSRVVPLWREYLMGGSSPKDLSPQFGMDFTKSPTTRNATSFLHRELKKKLKASPPNVPEFTTVSLNLNSEIPSAIAKLDDPASPSVTSTKGGRMNFNIPKDIPGNLAGDIGKNQTSCRAGAKPSPFNDERQASGYASAVRTGDNITVTPMIEFTVKDTIDLCPGDCGTTLEQIATVPLSQFEATGISGDVPFTVSFPAPSLGSFTISAPPPKNAGKKSE